MKGILYILLAYLAGECISWLMRGFIPGSVLGMAILFGALQLKLIKSEDVKGVCTFLLDNLMLFFVPVSVGIMVSYSLIGPDVFGVVAILILSTLTVMAVVGIMQQKWRKTDK